MKYAITILLIYLFSAFSASAQQTIIAAKARDYINKWVTVVDTVYDTKIFKTECHLFLGVPENKLVVVQKLKTKPQKNLTLNGFKISITGILKLIEGIPTIKLRGKILVLGPIDL